MDSLVTYRGSSSETDDETPALSDKEVMESMNAVERLRSKFQLNAAPSIDIKEDIPVGRRLAPGCKVVHYNPTYEEMFTPQIGPENPFKTDVQKAPKNILSGLTEPAHISHFHFENQRRTFESYGYALDPSADNFSGDRFIGAADVAESSGSKSVFETIKKRAGDKRKREPKGDPSDLENYKGPWAAPVDLVRCSKPSEEEATVLQRYESLKKKKGKKEEAEVVEEKSTLHIKDAVDYQGRSYLHIPQDLDVNLRSGDPPEKCFLPKKLIHTWVGHSKPVQCIRVFPKSGHLLLSAGMDSKIKLWEVYKERRMLRTFAGHGKGVRDICFSNDGSRFLSASYDRWIKLWDTETGECIGKFSTNKIPYCVQFNPDEDKQNLFIAGFDDKKMVTWDINENKITQEYDRHLGAVNTITFVDQNRRIVTTSDDKSLRVWEWDIPVDSKYIADPSMHSIPAVALSPNGKWMIGQSLDNKIKVFDVHNRFREHHKKLFKGHSVAGYACQVGFSPDSKYVTSGDGDGKLNIWDWKTTKLFMRFKAHDGVCIGCVWLPHETSKIVTCGWDNLIKLWD